MGKILSKNNDKNLIDNNLSKTIKSQYFSTVNKILRNNYDLGFNDTRIQSNMAICLEKKSFDDINDNSEINNMEYISWLDYLYNYLSIVQNEKKEWASEMIHKLDEEPFLTENKYLSHFFFKEFLLNMEPNCLKDPKDNDNGSNDNDSVDMGNNNDYELKVSMDNNNNLNMMRNLGGTFLANANVEVDNTSSNQESENEPEKKYKLYRNKVKKYIYIFKQHIVYKDHPINKVVQIFEQCWVKYVEKKMNFIINNFDDAENDNFNINFIIDEITRELQDFTIKLQNCLKLFYCRTIDFSCFNNEKDELINLLTTLIFRTGKIYDTVFKIQQIKLKSIADDMENKYNQLKDITPQQLGIEKQFCLNEETFNMQEEILEKEQKKYKDNEENIEKEEKKEDQKEDPNDVILPNKGVVELYLTEDQMDKRKIISVLADIKNKKCKIQSYTQNNPNMNSMKVNIDFNHEDNNVLLTQSYYKNSLNEENIIGSLYSRSRASLQSTDTEKNLPNDNRRTLNVNQESLKNNIFMNNFQINDDNDNSEQNFNNLIVRENNNNGRKTIVPFNFIKIFNRVSFSKDMDESGEFVSLPYETAIQLLKQIEKYKAPFEKMLIFASLGSEIKNCIDDFWKDLEDYIKNDLLGIEAEQLMTIFIYIIAKSQIKDIVVHCKLIQLFTTPMTKSSMIGYYYSNAEASVTYIQSLKDIKELYKGKGRIFENSVDIYTNSQ